MKCIALACLLLPATAAADGVDPHFNVGLELAGNGDTTLVAGRFHLGATVGLGDANVRPAIGLGLTAASGEVERDGATGPLDKYGF